MSTDSRFHRRRHPLGRHANNAVWVLDADLTHGDRQTKDSTFTLVMRTVELTERASTRAFEHRLLVHADHVCHNSIMRQRFRIESKAKKIGFHAVFLAFPHRALAAFR